MIEVIELILDDHKRYKDHKESVFLAYYCVNIKGDVCFLWFSFFRLYFFTWFYMVKGPKHEVNIL